METVPNPAVRAAVADAWHLRDAIVDMTIRYGNACQRYAYAVPGTEEKERRDRAARRRLRAVQRLTRALMRMAQDPTGLTYSRDVEPSGDPLPPGVHGYRVPGAR